MNKNLGLLCAVALVGFITLACDDETSSTESESTSELQLIFDLDREYNEPNGIGELSFPLPNDSIFSSKETWALTKPLGEVRLLSDWQEQLSLLGGAPLYPILSAPLSQKIELDDLLLRQTNDSMLDDAIYLMCLSAACKGELIPLDFGLVSQDYGLFNELNALAESSPYPSPKLLSPLSTPLSPMFAQEEKLADLKVILEQVAEPVNSLIWNREQQDNGYVLLSDAPSLGERAQVLNFRPKTSLKPKCEYAVLLTKALRSNDSTMSTRVMGKMPSSLSGKKAKIEALMEAGALPANTLASFWTFTTGDPTQLKLALRQAVTQELMNDDQGFNEVAKKSANFSHGVATTHRWASRESEAACEAREGLDCRVDLEQQALPLHGVRALAMAWADAQGNSSEQQTALYQSYQAVKGLFSGELNTWYVAKWQGASNANQLKLQADKRAFWCVIPSTGEYVDRELNAQTRQSPFPVILWADDSGHERLNLLLWAGYFARAGFASCAIESTVKDQALSPEFNLALSIKWRDYGFSSSLAQDVLDPDIDKRLYQNSSLAQVNRPLNRALTQQQFTWWLSQGNMGPLDQEFNTLKALTLLPNEAVDTELESQEYPLGALVYAGEGEGASAAIISGVMDPNTSAVVSVDLSADFNQQHLIGIGRGASDQFLNRDLGPWLIWDHALSAWRWTADSQGQASMQIQDQDGQTLPLSDHYQDERFSLERLNGKWVALYNQDQKITGQKVKISIDSNPVLSVPSMKGDLIRLQVFGSPEAQAWDVESSVNFIAPYSGAAGLAGTETARSCWRLKQWEHALDDPLELSSWIKGSEGSSVQELRTLMIAHPRAMAKPLAASLRMSEFLDLDFERKRSELYGLSAKAFLVLSQAYEASRAWGLPWMDWDDLDLLDMMTPAFTRNVQLSLQRQSFSGGYHALKMPWRLSQSSGLALPEDPEEPLETMTVNLINRFLHGLSYQASPEELNDRCLNELSPSLKACAFLSVTADELEALNSAE